jgi:hypothetical protein
MAKSVRRIVTAHNKAGKSVILMDGPATECRQPASGPATRQYGALDH